MTTTTMPTASTADASTVDNRTTIGTILVTGGASGLGAATVDAVQAVGGSPLVLDLAAPSDGVPY
jgi:hypothetical protein